MNGLPIVLSPSEEELEALRKKLGKLTGANDMWIEKLATKREKMFAVVVNPVVSRQSINESDTPSTVHVSKRDSESDCVVPADIIETEQLGDATGVEDLGEGTMSAGVDRVSVVVEENVVVDGCVGEDSVLEDGQSTLAATSKDYVEENTDEEDNTVTVQTPSEQAIPKPTTADDGTLLDEYKKRTMVSC